jgi:hypothetical protein
MPRSARTRWSIFALVVLAGNAPHRLYARQPAQPAPPAAEGGSTASDAEITTPRPAATGEVVKPGLQTAVPSEASGAKKNEEFEEIRWQLQSVKDEISKVLSRVEALQRDVEALQRDTQEKHRASESQLRDSEKRIAPLQVTIDSLRKEIAKSVPPSPFEDPRVWMALGLSFVTGIAMAVLAGCRTVSSAEATPRSRPLAASGPSGPIRKQIALSLGNPPEAWPELRSLAELTWQRTSLGARWREDWPELAHSAMNHSWTSDNQPTGRAAAADFAANVWVRFVSQFEPDRTSWKWTQEQCDGVLPDGLRIELGAVRPNDPYSRHAHMITQASGEGQFIADVHFPGCQLLDSDGRVLHELGAVVVKGDRL